jgi:hypothetical protein
VVAPGAILTISSEIDPGAYGYALVGLVRIGNISAETYRYFSVRSHGIAKGS